MAWFASFAKTDKAISATSKRGLKHPNYRLLGHPNLLQFSTTDDNANQNIPNCNVMVTINKYGEKFNSHLNQFILHEAKNEERK
jgi:hypothetical protein